ncbi:DUF1330 domain-containing protein [Thiosulfatihalobacter marinus]|jgi:uncharacterized protein (DUF1330 family)|uniref:DUF1330 domain-containing protein n=1 Tax=Thiosulfatihalobacter marinus TaxID=2792481 RepID=UPI0018D7B1F0|nr:DUF1330 domain-containing protein [Thiosulfatihalobacter marinus]
MTFVYMVARSREQGSADFDEYRTRTQPVVDAFQGKHVASARAQGGAAHKAPQMMVVRFGSISQARGFFESDAYAAARKPTTH